MADSLRNEIDISLQGERTMRATFGAIRAIERQLGKSITRIINDLGTHGDMSVTDAALIVHEGLKAHGDKDMTLDQVGEALIEEGFSARVPAVISFLSIALRGPSLGKPQPETVAE